MDAERKARVGYRRFLRDRAGSSTGTEVSGNSLAIRTFSFNAVRTQMSLSQAKPTW